MQSFAAEQGRPNPKRGPISINDKIRLGLFAASAIAALSLSACKTTDEAAQDSAPPAAEAAPAPTDASSMPPADDTSMPAPTSSSTPMTTP